MFNKNDFTKKIGATLAMLYPDVKKAEKRYLDAIGEFFSLYGETDDFSVFSVAGRSEICGNHTDHNHGEVAAASIDLDIIAVAAKTRGNTVRVKSFGFDEDVVSFAELSPDESEHFRSSALIRGVCAKLKESGRKYGGFNAYTTSDILKGSGLSSSAAFEDIIGTIENYFYNDGQIGFSELAQISQYAENVYFGKPCGLMDQIACAAGGFVHIDFADPSKPVTRKVDFDPGTHGFSLYIVGTGGSHADLNDDYASIPAEMKSVAAFFSRPFLRGTTEEELIANAAEIRRLCGDRALLRALHFVRENDRVRRLFGAIEADDIEEFLSVIRESGISSAMLLQNYYTPKSPSVQGISLACAIAERVIGKYGACRVHGGGFAGTAQMFVPIDKEDAFVSAMESAFGKGAAVKLKIRSLGAAKIF